MASRKWRSHPAPKKTTRSKSQHRLLLGSTLGCIASLCFAGKSIANPLGEHIKQGSAEFLRDGGNLFIQQNSKALILDWKEFSIKQGELTRFFQPDSSSAALNRVFGGNPSEIYGALKGNGRIYLINPNGVFIGPSGRVDAGSFTASTLDISDEEFLKGGELHFSGNSEASVVNLGTINALDGNVFLIAKNVENRGEINAPNGTVGLLGGTDIILQPEGQDQAGVSIASGTGRSINSGTIAAARAELKAAGGNLYALAIQNSGVIRATGVQRQGGKVLLRAGRGTVENSGVIVAKNRDGSGGQIALGAIDDAANPATISRSEVRVVNRGKLDASGSSGGSVKLAAEKISLEETSQILASGSAGSGGDVEIHGSEETIRSASIDASGETTGGLINLEGDTVSIDSATTFLVNGAAGGGSVRLMATASMRFDGSISAVATAPEAHGGFAEISGMESLEYNGVADLRSTLGAVGTVLLDPGDFTIGTTNVAVIANNLLSSSVVIATSPTGSGSGDIFVNAPLIYSSGNNLTLLAHRHIAANASIQNSSSGNLNLVAGWDGSTGASGTNFDLFTANPASFGNQFGAITIGNGSQGAKVAVGSRLGKTNVAGYGLTLTGSGGSNGAFAQLGFAPVSGNLNAGGSIQVVAKQDVTVAGGQANFAFAQIGHGGSSAHGDFTGGISIVAGGELKIVGGVNFAYAQVGHGGDGSQGLQSGDILIDANSLSVTGGVRPNAYSQIGHGDAAGGSTGNRSGKIEILVHAETTLLNGPASNASWMVGHRTSSPGAVSNAPVSFATGTLDYATTLAPLQVPLSRGLR